MLVGSQPGAMSSDLVGAIFMYTWVRIVIALVCSVKAIAEYATNLTRQRDENGDPTLLQDSVVFCDDIPAEGKTKLVFTVTDELKAPLGEILRMLAASGCTVCHETMP